MKKPSTHLLITSAFLASSFLLTPGFLRAQAPPGPMPGTAPAAGEPAPATKAQEPPQQPAKPNLSGSWKFNREQSDDARQKMQEARGSSGGGNNGGNGGGNSGGNGGNGPYGGGGGGRMGGGWPGGGVGMGGGGGRGGNGGHRGNGGNGQNDEGRETIREIMSPADSLKIAQTKDSAPEIDLTDEQNRKRVFYTDGRKLQKSKDDKYQEETAAWQDGRLVAYIPEKQGAIKRTFEVAPGGEQLIETVQVPVRQQQSSQSSSPVVIRYVYDLVQAPK